MNRELSPVEVREAVSLGPSGLLSWLPMPPWEGPPLPRFLDIRWPWLQTGATGKFDDYFTGQFEFHSGREVSTPMREEIEFLRDDAGAIKKLIKRRSPGDG